MTTDRHSGRTLSILYRGPLSSCNYGCPYCPFSKHSESNEEHAADARALERFILWVEAQTDKMISVFFTPWGEALIRKRYQDAIVRLTQMTNVEKVAIQTNLSCRLDWADRCDRDKLRLWTTYHPGEVSRERFLTRCREADRRGVRYSVGIVGLKEHIEEIEALRWELSPHVYLWINAYKRVLNYYTADEIGRITAVDSLFPINNQQHQSRGMSCRTGRNVISVDGDGTVRRCHFVRNPIGNIYDPGFAAILQERLCPNDTCGCHIGYVHLDSLGLYDVFGPGVLERIPTRILPMAPAAHVSATGR